MIQFTSLIQRTAKTDLSHVMEMYLTHELTHCFQQTPSGKPLIPVWPRWMMEGMACYAAEDPLQDDQIKMLGQTGIRDLDGVSGNDAYPRGRLFFKYFHETFGAEKLKAMVAQLLKGD